ncbi:MAG: hypothetical protein ACE5E5_10420 [Phycisphaerae bacterium]
MNSIRITGVVAFADQVRRELSGSVTETRVTVLQADVAAFIRNVDLLLAEHGAHADELPTPTRRAYAFLSGLDFDAVPTVASSGAAAALKDPDGSVRLPGVTKYWRRMLRLLARATTASELDTRYNSIRKASQNIEGLLDDEGVEGRALTAQSRTARGWLAMFADRMNFDAYMAAVGRARTEFDTVLRGGLRFQPPAWVEFQPLRGLYKIRDDGDGTQIMLPTPMMVFSSTMFAQLAEAALLGTSREPIIAATASKEYQGVLAELEALSGEENGAGGVHRNLDESFDGVNHRYFGGTMARPRLKWSRQFTGRKFGHYDAIHDTVMISCSLDCADVAPHVLDFVVYHELLHKKLGSDWRHGRANAHTPEFRREERRFEQYADARAALQALAE